MGKFRSADGCDLLELNTEMLGLVGMVSRDLSAKGALDLFRVGVSRNLQQFVVRFHRVSLAGHEALEANDGARLCALGLSALVAAIREGDLDARADTVSELRAFGVARTVGVRRLFDLTCLLERRALDETLGTSSEEWPAVAQLVRHASFNCLAAVTEQVAQESTSAIFDTLTTVHTRAVLQLALEKEVRRSGRASHSRSCCWMLVVSRI